MSIWILSIGTVQVHAGRAAEARDGGSSTADHHLCGAGAGGAAGRGLRAMHAPGHQ